MRPTPRPKPVALRIELLEIEPLIWRRALVSNQWTLASLHGYLQWVMGWQDSHASAGSAASSIPGDSISTGSIATGAGRSRGGGEGGNAQSWSGTP